MGVVLPMNAATRHVRSYADTQRVKVPNLSRQAAQATQVAYRPAVTATQTSAKHAVTVFAVPRLSGSITPDRLSDNLAPTFSYSVQGGILELRTNTGAERRIELPFIVTRALAVDFNRALCFSRGVSFDPSETLAAPVLLLAGYDPEKGTAHFLALDMNSGARFSGLRFAHEAYGPSMIRASTEPGVAAGAWHDGTGLKDVRRGRDRISFTTRIQLGFKPTRSRGMRSFAADVQLTLSLF